MCAGYLLCNVRQTLQQESQGFLKNGTTVTSGGERETQDYVRRPPLSVTRCSLQRRAVFQCSVRDTDTACVVVRDAGGGCVRIIAAL